MKRFLSFLLLVFVLSGCDDGDLAQVSFDFDNTPASQCGTGTSDFFIYKTQDKRVLIIQISEENFKNIVSVDQTPPPETLLINGSSIRLIYREYSGTVTANTICSAVPPATPIVVEEREATAGEITIITTAIKTEPDANGATQITHFLHTLVFNDLVFEIGDAKQINEAFTQITYQTEATDFTNFSNLTGVKSCDDDPTYLFKYLDKQALILDLSDEDAAALFTGEPGPKQRLFSANTKLQQLFYDRLSSAFLNDDYFCINPPPTSPQVIDTFTSVNGVENQSGIIEVTSLASDNGFKHTIVLKNVRLAKGTLTRQLGNEFIFGEFETTN